MTTIADAATHIRRHPAPVILLDTGSLLDPFRRDSARKQPRVTAEEIRATAALQRSFCAIAVQSDHTPPVRQSF